MSHFGHLEGEQPYLGDLLTMAINHLLSGMILQIWNLNIFLGRVIKPRGP